MGRVGMKGMAALNVQARVYYEIRSENLFGGLDTPWEVPDTGQGV